MKYRPEKYHKHHFGGERSVYSRLLKEFDKTKAEQRDNENQRLLLKLSKKWHNSQKLQNPQKWQNSIRKRMTSRIPGVQAKNGFSAKNNFLKSHFHEKPKKPKTTHISGMKWHPGMFMINKRSSKPNPTVDPYDEDQIGNAIDDLMLRMKQNSRMLKENELRHSNSDHGYLDSEHLGEANFLNFLFERTGNAN